MKTEQHNLTSTSLVNSSLTSQTMNSYYGVQKGTQINKAKQNTVCECAGKELYRAVTLTLYFNLFGLRER